MIKITQLHAWSNLVCPEVIIALLVACTTVRIAMIITTTNRVEDINYTLVDKASLNIHSVVFGSLTVLTVTLKVAIYGQESHNFTIKTQENEAYGTLATAQQKDYEDS